MNRPTEGHPPRMVHVLGSLDVGGLELRQLDLLHHLPPTEVEQIFLTMAGRKGILADRYEALGARVDDSCPQRPTLTFPFRLWRTLRRLRPDVLVAHTSVVSGLIVVVGRLAGIPSRIAWQHSDGDGRPSTPARRAFRSVMRALVRRYATAVLGVTEGSVQFLLPRPGRLAGAGEVLSHGTDTDRFTLQDRPACRQRLGLAPETVVIGHVGRAEPVKNRAFLIDVLHAACARETAVLVLCGPGGDADVVEAHPDVRGDDDVVFTGPTDDVPTLLGAIDVLALPSHWEGLPSVALEALACGVPVVANDLPGTRDLASQVEGVTLVDTARGPEAWADAVLAAATIDDAGRAACREAFLTSPYTLEAFARSWRAMW